LELALDEVLMLSVNTTYDASTPPTPHLQPFMNSNFHFLIICGKCRHRTDASLCSGIMLKNYDTSLE